MRQGAGRVHTLGVNPSELVTDAIDLVRARITGPASADAVLLIARGLGQEADGWALVHAQTQVAAMLVRVIAEHEGRSPESVLDSLALAVMRLRELDADL